jgi:helicase required for RNAi-mediated heterochromatin assembly 1
METEARFSDDDADTLSGAWVPLPRQFSARGNPRATSRAIEAALQADDMWAIPQHLRGEVYLRLEQKFKDFIRGQFRSLGQGYMDIMHELRIGKWEADAMIVQGAKLIGMTTTGLSKYRPLVAGLRPKILLVEEAAETLEGLVTAGCVESLEHLILVG